MNDKNSCFMSKTLNAFSQNSKTRSYSVLPRSPSFVSCEFVHRIYRNEIFVSADNGFDHKT